MSERGQRPLVGVSLCTDGRGRWRAGRDYHYLHARYARALERAGARVVYLPAQSDAVALVAALDGLLVPGGDDLPPPGGAGDLPLDPVTPAQLAFDRALLDAARARELPVLGICYGAQLMALHGGGSLHYHLPTERPELPSHRLGTDDATHALHVEPGTRLSRVLGDAALVNSLHHQGVASVGDGWRVAARAADGLIEALESRDGAWRLGVQWHPELLDDAASTRLFAAFLRACVP